jgi:hypothetical protein
MEIGRMALWIVGAVVMAAGALLVGYFLGFKAGERQSNLAKDLRISLKQEQIARLEKAMRGEASSVPDN